MDSIRIHITVPIMISCLLTTSLILVYIAGTLKNSYELARLKKDVNELTYIVLHAKIQPPNLETGDGILNKILLDITNDIMKRKARLIAKELQMRAENCYIENEPNALAQPNKRINYASEEMGAVIMSVEAVPWKESSFINRMFGSPFGANPPISMLQESLDPGHCFAYKNEKAVVTIKLANEIYIEDIEVAHISIYLTQISEMKSAPKAISVYGLDSRNKNDEIFLGFIIFDDLSKPIQTFPLQPAQKYNLVRFKFDGNHGNENYTCVYRIAVYGKLDEEPLNYA